ERRRPEHGCRGVLEPQDRDPRARRAGRPPAGQAAPPDRVGGRPQPLLPAVLQAGRVRPRAAAAAGRPAPAADADPRGVDGLPGRAAAVRAATGGRPGGGPQRGPPPGHARPRAHPGPAGDAALARPPPRPRAGRGPIRVLDTAKDWAWQSEMWCYGLWGFGVRP